jgi:hypothetical protein
VLNLHGAETRNGHIDSSFGDPTWAEMPGIGKAAFWFLGDDPEGPMVVSFCSPPSPDITPAHSHPTDQIRIILEGSFRIGRTWYGPGEIRAQEADRVYGPEEQGPEGSKQILVMANRQHWFPTFARKSDREMTAPMVEMLRSTFAPAMGGVAKR